MTVLPIPSWTDRMQERAGDGTTSRQQGTDKGYSSAVLVVSQDDNLVETVRNLLSTRAHVVDTATSLEEATTKGQYAFDAVIVDPSLQIKMEDTTSMASPQADTAMRLLELFKGADPYLPVVVVQSTPQPPENRADTLQSLMNRGANGFYGIDSLTHDEESRGNFLRHLDELVRTRAENQRGIVGTIGMRLAEHLTRKEQVGEFPPDLGSAVVYTYGRNRRVGDGQRRMAWYRAEAIQGACSPVDPRVSYSPGSTGFYLKLFSSRQEAEEAISDGTRLKGEMPHRKTTAPIGYYLTQTGNAVMVWSFFIAMTGGHLQRTLSEQNIAQLNDSDRKLARGIASADTQIHLENIIDWFIHTRQLTRPEDSQRAAQRYIDHLSAIPETAAEFTSATRLNESEERSYKAALAVMNDPWQLSLFSAVMDSFDENYGYARGIQQPDAQTIIKAYAPNGGVDTQLMRGEYANWDYKPLGTRGTVWVDVFHELDSPRRGLSDREKLQHARQTLVATLNTEDSDLFRPHVWDLLRAASYKASRKAYVYLGHMQRTLLMGARHENLDEESISNMVKDGIDVFNHYMAQAAKWWTTTAAFYAQRGQAQPQFEDQIDLIIQILSGQAGARADLDRLALESLPQTEQTRVARLRNLAGVYTRLEEQHQTVSTDKLLSAALTTGVLQV